MTSKPAKNHPWRREVNSKIYNWAKEQSTVSKVHDFHIGQLSKDKSKNRGGLIGY